MKKARVRKVYKGEVKKFKGGTTPKKFPPPQPTLHLQSQPTPSSTRASQRLKPITPFTKPMAITVHNDRLKPNNHRQIKEPRTSRSIKPSRRLTSPGSAWTTIRPLEQLHRKFSQPTEACRSSTTPCST